VVRTSNYRVIAERELLLLAAMVRSFAHMPLGISDHNKMVLWPGCGGRAVWSLHKKNVRSVRFVVKRRCCCNISGGVTLNVWFTTNGMCAKNNNIYVTWTSSDRVIAAHELYCCLLPRCKALRTCCSGFSDHNSSRMCQGLLKTCRKNSWKMQAAICLCHDCTTAKFRFALLRILAAICSFWG